MIVLLKKISSSEKDGLDPVVYYGGSYIRDGGDYCQTVGATTKRDCHMRTLTGYGIGVVIVLAVLNGMAWEIGTPRLHNINVFSAGFILGVVGTYIAAWMYGYRQIA